MVYHISKLSNFEKIIAQGLLIDTEKNSIHADKAIYVFFHPEDASLVAEWLGFLSEDWIVVYINMDQSKLLMDEDSLGITEMRELHEHTKYALASDLTTELERELATASDSQVDQVKINFINRHKLRPIDSMPVYFGHYAFKSAKYPGNIPLNNLDFILCRQLKIWDKSNGVNRDALIKTAADFIDDDDPMIHRDQPTKPRRIATEVEDDD